MICGPSIRALNINVLMNAPCSVAILVDRRALKDSRVAVSSLFIFHACLIFIGGADDREALIYGSRMCEQPNISLTVIHITDTSHDSTGDLVDKKLDLAAIDRFKDSYIYNDHVSYKVEGAREGTETVRVLQSLNHVDYDLLMVGRRHNAEWPTMLGLDDWSEKISDLGIIGDILVSPDIKSKAAVMVVQQHSSDQEPGFQSPPLTPTKYLRSITTVGSDMDKCNSLNHFFVVQINI